MDNEYCDALDLEELTGTKASTWRYFAMVDRGRVEAGEEPLYPPSFKLGRRRVWKRSSVLAWLESRQASEPAFRR